MELTKNMKRSVVESLQQKGLELSDEELDDISGGRAWTVNESGSVLKASEEVYLRTDNAGPVYRRMFLRYHELATQYLKYTESLPEGSPEVLFQDTEFYKKLWEEETMP